MPKYPTLTHDCAKLIRKQLKDNPELTDAQIDEIFDRLTDPKPANWRISLAIAIVRNERRNLTVE